VPAGVDAGSRPVRATPAACAARFIAEAAVGVADQDEDLGGEVAQILRLEASVAVRVVALGQLAERGADVLVARLVAEAEHLERVEPLERVDSEALGSSTSAAPCPRRR
jgi:hypothetical protein